jgi:hypothetical protein
MKRHIFVFVSFLLISGFGYSQDYSFRNVNDLMNSSFLRDMGDRLKSQEYEGSPYENDEFIIGSLVTKSKQVFKDVPLRLNIFNDDIEFKNSEDNIFAIENPELFEHIIIGDSKIMHLPFIVGNKVKKSYMEVLEEGELVLLAKSRVIFKEAVKPAAYKDAQPAMFKRVPDMIYIKVGEQGATLINSKRDLIKILSPMHPDVSDYIKKNKIKANKIDIRKLVNHYNLN